MACRAFVKAALVGFVLLVILVLWYTYCNTCIFWLTALTCGASVLGAPFLTPACLVGIACALIRGVHLGSGPLHFDVKWEAQ